MRRWDIGKHLEYCPAFFIAKEGIVPLTCCIVYK
jgi:hypothetical protein